jgi:hypothetical protein
MKLVAKGRQNSFGVGTPSLYFLQSITNKGVRSIHRRMNIKTKDLTCRRGDLFSLSVALAYVYENVVAANFDRIAVHAYRWIHR